MNNRLEYQAVQLKKILPNLPLLTATSVIGRCEVRSEEVGPTSVLVLTYIILTSLHLPYHAVLQLKSNSHFHLSNMASPTITTGKKGLFLPPCMPLISSHTRTPNRLPPPLNPRPLHSLRPRPRDNLPPLLPLSHRPNRLPLLLLPRPPHSRLPERRHLLRSR